MTYKMILKIEKIHIHKKSLKFLRNFVFIHNNTKHLHYLNAFYTFVYMFESFCLHVIFE
jgi:hypothetical protein